MTLLNTADRIYLGAAEADAVFAGSVQVWPPINTGFAYFDAATAENATVTGGGLIVTNTGSGMASQGARVAAAKTSGKFYYESVLTAWVTGGSVGLGGVGVSTASFYNIQNGAIGGVLCMTAAGQIWKEYAVVASIGTRASGDAVGYAIDLDNRRFWCRVVYPAIGLWNGSGAADPTTPSTGIVIPSGSITPYCTFGGISTGPGNKVTTNFGNTGFYVVTPIPGFTAGWTL